MMSQVIALEVQPLSPADAEVISRWRYEGPYAFYNRPSGRESESVSYMLDPRNGFHAVRSASGLIGFCSFGVDGRVRGGGYDDDALDVGAGMDPGVVGRGHGHTFLNAVVEHATVKLGASRLRATVASWNERALRALRSVGFRPLSTFQTDKGIDFTILLRETVGTAGREAPRP
jgi:[ribosomal protein S18]-alanine N-acetyltransferase